MTLYDHGYERGYQDGRARKPCEPTSRGPYAEGYRAGHQAGSDAAIHALERAHSPEVTPCPNR